MKVSKRMQKKRKANMRTIGIVLCVIIIAAALVVIFLPSNNTNKNTVVANTATDINQNIIANTNNVNSIATNNSFTSNIVVTTNSNTINQNTVATNTNTTTSNTVVTTDSNTQTQQQDNSSSSNDGWNIFNWGSKEVDEDKAKEIAVSEFAKLGETVNKVDLQAFPLKRNDGKDYYYIKSSKNTCEVRKEDGVVTRINANPVNQ